MGTLFVLTGFLNLLIAGSPSRYEARKLGDRFARKPRCAPSPADKYRKLCIIGTGFLAVPVLAGSAAYAIGEARCWPTGLARKPKKAKAFYATLMVATIVGAMLNFSPINPIRAITHR